MKALRPVDPTKLGDNGVKSALELRCQLLCRLLKSLSSTPSSSLYQLAQKTVETANQALVMQHQKAIFLFDLIDAANRMLNHLNDPKPLDVFSNTVQSMQLMLSVVGGPQSAQALAVSDEFCVTMRDTPLESLNHMFTIIHGFTSCNPQLWSHLNPTSVSTLGAFGLSSCLQWVRRVPQHPTLSLLLNQLISENIDDLPILDVLQLLLTHPHHLSEPPVLSHLVSHLHRTYDRQSLSAICLESLRFAAQFPPAFQSHLTPNFTLDTFESIMSSSQPMTDFAAVSIVRDTLTELVMAVMRHPLPTIHLSPPELLLMLANPACSQPTALLISSLVTQPDTLPLTDDIPTEWPSSLLGCALCICRRSRMLLLQSEQISSAPQQTSLNLALCVCSTMHAFLPLCAWSTASHKDSKQPATRRVIAFATHTLSQLTPLVSRICHTLQSSATSGPTDHSIHYNSALLALLSLLRSVRCAFLGASTAPLLQPITNLLSNALSPAATPSVISLEALAYLTLNLGNLRDSELVHFTQLFSQNQDLNLLISLLPALVLRHHFTIPLSPNANPTFVTSTAIPQIIQRILLVFSKNRSLSCSYSCCISFFLQRGPSYRSSTPSRSIILHTLPVVPVACTINSYRTL